MKNNFTLVFKVLLIVSFFFPNNSGIAQLSVGEDKLGNIGKSLYLAVDKQIGQETPPVSANFLPVENKVPLYDGSEYSFWFKFTIENKTNQEKLLLEIYNSSIDTVELFLKNQTGQWLKTTQGRAVARSNWTYDLSHLFFDLPISPGESKEIYLRVKNPEQFSLPVNIGTKDDVLYGSYREQLLFGIYAGIMLALFLYNMFVSFTVRDKSYIYYVAHTLFVLLTQASAAGFTFLYLWPNNIWLSKHSFVLFTCLVTIAGIRFFFEFLKVKQFQPKMYYFFRVIEIIYLAIFILELLNFRKVAYSILFPLQGLNVLLIFGVSLMILFKGYRPAKIYILAWSVLLIGVVIFALKDFNVLPYNYLTVNTIQIGSAIEAILLSIALADKINALKKENELSQKEALGMARENERIIREQNLELEKRVEGRTMQLQEANEELQVTLDNLKDTQTQLVDAEKMASLGQLTAGIAHEINNPINFVTSNINPLKLDLGELYQIIDRFNTLNESSGSNEIAEAKDLVQELDYEFLRDEINSLVGGISDGAMRTSEIVRGLRTFSRLDEDVVKEASLNEGIDSTLILLKNKTKDLIDVVCEYDSDLPNIECYPGKLNQAFMNILNNGIYAVSHKNYENDEKPTLTLKTIRNDDETVSVHLADNGIGMDEETKKKVYDPFFTTKDVGEGTGLGMSIVFKIVDKHGGHVEINSTLGKGTEFILTLPMKQPSEFK